MYERGRLVEIGESFVGESAEAAHINTVFGGHDGPVRVDALDDEVLANTPRRPDGDDIGAILLARAG